MAAVDRALMAKLMEDIGDDRAVMQDLVDTFLKEGPKIVGEMRDALERGDRRTFNRGAHSLKSTSATFGATALSHLCRALEADTEASLPRDAPTRFASVAAEWERVRGELAAWRP